MSLAALLRKRYYELIVKIKQDRAAKLPYYGPLVRGWLGDALYTDKMLYSVLFKNPSIDVRPFFFYTAKERDEIRLNMRFMGFSVHFVKELVLSLSKNVESHLGGVPCRIEALSYEEKEFASNALERKIRVNFISPSALVDGDTISVVPSLPQVTRALVRQANKFTKYYVKDVYPIRVGGFNDGTATGFTIDSFFWQHRNVRGELMPLKGVWGFVEYGLEDMTEETRDILRLAPFFQIGKWVSYGFGKIAVVAQQQEQTE